MNDLAVAFPPAKTLTSSLSLESLQRDRLNAVEDVHDRRCAIHDDSEAAIPTIINVTSRGHRVLRPQRAVVAAGSR